MFKAVVRFSYKLKTKPLDFLIATRIAETHKKQFLIGFVMDLFWIYESQAATLVHFYSRFRDTVMRTKSPFLYLFRRS